jgi:hypothetical protein
LYAYTGGGQNAYYPGVPARDLTDEEYAALPEDVKAAGLYERAPDAKSGAKRAEAPPGPGAGPPPETGAEAPPETGASPPAEVRP